MVKPRTLVMGVLNVTPDSFSDGGQWLDPDVAIAHGRHLLTEGADLLDVGGESTRPGAARVPEAEERARVVPVISALAEAGARVSVDTMRASVAQAALEAGATLINDVSGGMSDPQMVDLVAQTGCQYVLSHWRGPSDVMTTLAHYDDAARDVRRELLDRVELFVDAGVAPEQLILDPGLGFAKNADHNWQILANIDLLLELGYPVLIGASRKRFLGELLDQYGSESLPTFRDRATAAVTALLAERGVWAVRVHEVAASVDAIRVAHALRAARGGRSD